MGGGPVGGGSGPDAGDCGHSGFTDTADAAGVSGCQCDCFGTGVSVAGSGGGSGDSAAGRVYSGVYAGSRPFYCAVFSVVFAGSRVRSSDGGIRGSTGG